MSRNAVSGEVFSISCVFRRGELAFESVEQAIEDVALSIIERDSGMFLPEFGLAKHVGERVFRAVEGAIEAPEEPLDPGGDIEVALLRCFEHVVVGIALPTDLRRHAVEALRAVLGARERHIGDRTRDAPVAVVERVDGHEPQMGDGGLEDRIDRRLAR